MSSAVAGTAQALRGLHAIYERVSKFHAQHAFFRGVPVAYENGDPIGILDNYEPAQVRLFNGAYGCGKSYILDYTLLVLMAEQPDNLAVVLRKRFEQLRNTTLATFYQIVDEATDGDKNKLIADQDDQEGAVNVWIRTAGKPSKIVFRVEPDGTNEAVRDSLKGYELGVFGLDEATQLKQVSYDTLKTRLRRPGFVLAGLVATNPARESHWVTRLSQESERTLALGERPDPLLIRARAFDNPYVRADYVDALKEQFKNDPEGYDMYVLGLDGMDIQGKPVFRKDFNDKIHVDSGLKVNPFKPVYVGLDFGYHHPAAVWVQPDDQERFNVIGELNPQDISVETFADLILEFNKKHFKDGQKFVYVGDPAGAQQTDKGDTTIQRLSQRGISVFYKKSEITEGVEAIRDLLVKSIGGRPRLVFHKRCAKLIMAFRGGYYYREKASGGFTDKPHKDGEYDHCVDALRYVIVNTALKGFASTNLPTKLAGMSAIQLY